MGNAVAVLVGLSLSVLLLVMAWTEDEKNLQKAVANTPAQILSTTRSTRHILEHRYKIKYPESMLLSAVIKEASSTDKVDESLIMAMIFVESTYKWKSESRAGAKGYMQVMSVWDGICPYKRGNQYDNVLQGSCALKHSVVQAGNLDTGLIVYNIGITNYLDGDYISSGQTYRDKVLKEQKELEKLL